MRLDEDAVPSVSLCMSMAKSGAADVDDDGDSDGEASWVTLPRTRCCAVDGESMPERVRRVEKDLQELVDFYNISVAPRRRDRLRAWFSEELESLFGLDFDALPPQDQADFLLLRNFLRRSLRQLDIEWQALKAAEEAVVPFAPIIVELCEARQDVKPITGEQVARRLDEARQCILAAIDKVERGQVTVATTTGLKAARMIEELHGRLDELYGFYARYDPMFDWWATRPYSDAVDALMRYLRLVQTKLAGMGPAEADDEIVGEPVGREFLLVELEAEMIAYTPEELIALANDQLSWCRGHMTRASRELGFGDDWRRALDHVKSRHVGPGEQPQLVLDLALEGATFVKEHDLVTVPRVAEETYRMFMMTPARQKVAPFFLGGPSIQVSYPTADMPHRLKEMVMRGNNRHFSRATAFHELIPGHRLQLYMVDRYNAHRAALFSTPFVVEGWAMYWEMCFWDRGDFFVTPEDRVGTLFWRMHRCARIILSLRFHLGDMTAQECVDALVTWVGHERSTAEGEVRRWFNGEWAPLYQCGYMLGALQLVRLREEALACEGMGEKEFNDRVLKANMMPIELMRALMLGLELRPEYRPHWKFYD